MARPDRARFALGLLLTVVGCGDPAAPGEAQSTGTGDTSTDPDSSGEAPTPTTGAGSSSTGEVGSGDGSGSDDTGAPACDPSAPLLSERDFIRHDDPRTGLVLAPCGEDRWYFAAASESTLEIVLRRIDGGAVEAAVAYPDEPPAQVWPAALFTPFVSDAAAVSAIFPVPRSGEFALHVRSDAPDAPAGYALEVRCILGCERESTRFPLLMVHGWTGFESIGPLTYFYNVADTLTDLGYPLRVAILDPYNSTTVRSVQLAEQLGETLYDWRARKVNLIGHSQGGIDSRAVVSSLGHGGEVSALVTIASPHRGTYVTDLALGLAPGGVEDLLGLLLNFVGAVTAQQKSDATASFYSLSEQYMQEEFNPQNPDDPRVEYISFTGRTCDALAYLNPANNCHDLVDPLIGWSYALLQAARGDNDGLVTVDSAKWGDYRGEMAADHIDEVGQILGITDPGFDHLAFYRDRARELAAGLH